MKHNHFKMADYLISEDADINTEDKYGATPLIFVISRGNIEQVNYLI